MNEKSTYKLEPSSSINRKRIVTLSKELIFPIGWRVYAPDDACHYVERADKGMRDLIDDKSQFRA